MANMDNHHVPSTLLIFSFMETLKLVLGLGSSVGHKVEKGVQVSCYTHHFPGHGLLINRLYNSQLLSLLQQYSKL